MLHGGKNGQKSRNKHAISNPNSELPKASKQARSERMAPSLFKGQRNPQGDRGDVSRNSARKRKADSYEEHRLARRQRVGAALQKQRAPDLKDEAWLRRTMHVPTTTDYPDISEKFFKDPKPSLINAVQGLASLMPTFVTLAHEVFQCILRYESVARTEVVEGEGRSKVG